MATRQLKVWMPLVRTGTGAETYTRALADELARRGHRVTLAEAAHAFQYAPWLSGLRPARDDDVVLANSWSAAAFGRDAIPLVSVCHLVVHDPVLRPYKSTAQAAFHRRFVLPMERSAVARAALNVAVSPTVARQMARHLGAHDVRVVENGIDTEYFRMDRPDRAPGTPFRLLFVGKPSRRKGFDTVERIVEALGDEVSFTSVGHPPGPGLPRPAGRYPGVLPKEGVRTAYSQADLLLMPSRMEGFGLAAAEAMAAGVPVAACPGTAVDDLIPAGGGIVRRPDDVDGFVADIRALIGDPDRHRAMRTQVAAHAAAAFSQHRWVAEMEAALLSVVP